MSRSRGRNPHKGFARTFKQEIRGESWVIRSVTKDEIEAAAHADLEPDEIADVGEERIDGLCVRQGETREILLRLGLDEKTELATTLHEAMHATMWDLSEECVHEIEAALAAILWRRGWRKRRK